MNTDFQVHQMPTFPSLNMIFQVVVYYRKVSSGGIDIFLGFPGLKRNSISGSHMH